MNLKILASLAVLGIAAAGTTYGTFAFFSDTETSTNNIFTAGDLDLTLDGLNGVTATITGTNFAPGDSTSGSVLLRNEGSIFTGDAQGHTVDLDLQAITVVTDDLAILQDPDNGAPSRVRFDQWLEVTTLTYNGASLLGSVGDRDGDGRANTLADLDLAGVFTDLADPGAAGKSLALGVAFLESGPNHLKRDVVTLRFTFLLAQSIAPDLGTLVAYSTNFSTAPGSEWSTTTTTTYGSEKVLGPFDASLKTLSLSGLPTHEEITIEFDLILFDTWDGNNNVYGPDGWNLYVDGTPVVATNFANNPTFTQCWPSNCAASYAGYSGAVLVGASPFNPGDSVYRIVKTIPHTASTLVVGFESTQNQALVDESWGIDNVRIVRHV